MDPPALSSCMDSSDRPHETAPSIHSPLEHELPYSREVSQDTPVKSLGGEENEMVIYEPSELSTQIQGGTIARIDPNDMRRGFDHCYVQVPFKDRLSVLFATLRRSSERKVIVICSTWESCQFHAILFRQLEMLNIFELHDKMNDVAQRYDEFMYKYPGILFCSCIALREFSIPENTDYIIQYEPPTCSPNDYIFRMSNARIYRTSCHKALLFLTPDELTVFLQYFDQIRNEELEARKVSGFQDSVEKLLKKHSELNKYAWIAFRSFLHAYKNHSHANIYKEANIDESAVRLSFGEPLSPKQVKPKKTDNKKSGDGETKIKSDDAKRPHQWMEKEKSWRKGIKPQKEESSESTHKSNQWMGKEEKVWRSTDTKPWITSKGIKSQKEESSESTHKSNQWMGKEEKVWRSTDTKPWITREQKTWKHSHKMTVSK